MRFLTAFSCLSFLFIMPKTHGVDKPFPQWLKQLKQEALAKGFQPLLVKTALDVTYREQILKKDQNQPEQKRLFQEYKSALLSPSRIRKGQQILSQHHALLEKIEQTYGVPKSLLVAITGVESFYGLQQGKIPVGEALVALAYHSRRSTFFRREVFAFLNIVKTLNIPPKSLLGSWAGALGMIQFLPTTYLAYAVDFDADGKTDIWKNWADAFASVASFLKQRGWNTSSYWFEKVSLPPQFLMPAHLKSGCTLIEKLPSPNTLPHWRTKRLKLLSKYHPSLPTDDQKLYLITLDNNAYLVTSHYLALLSYNCSHYYALSITHLAHAFQQ